MATRTRGRRRAASVVVVEDTPPAVTVDDPRRCSICNQTQDDLYELDQVNPFDDHSRATTQFQSIVAPNRLYACAEAGCTTPAICLHCSARQRISMDIASKHLTFHRTCDTTWANAYTIRCDDHDVTIFSGAIQIKTSPQAWLGFCTLNVVRFMTVLAVLLFWVLVFEGIRCSWQGTTAFSPAYVYAVQGMLVLLFASIGFGDVFLGSHERGVFYSCSAVGLICALDPYQILWLQQLPQPSMLVMCGYMLGAAWVLASHMQDVSAAYYNVSWTLLRVYAEQCQPSSPSPSANES